MSYVNLHIRNVLLPARSLGRQKIKDSEPFRASRRVTQLETARVLLPLLAQCSLTPRRRYTRCTFLCHVCLIPIWNFASDPLPIFLSVNSGHGSTTEKTDGTCNSEHCGARPSYTHPTRANHSRVRCADARVPAYAGSTCPHDLSPARARGGAGSCPRLPVAKRRGFHKPDRGFLASFPPLVRFGKCEFRHHVGHRN